jgi:hypothetical protein
MKSSTTCRIRAWPFDYRVKAGQPAGSKGFRGDTRLEKFGNRMSIPGTLFD